MPEPERSHALDHIVVVMFENRSFDNLLGYLRPAGDAGRFEGVAGRDLSNPIPSDAPGSERRVVPVHPAENFDTPDPDPGEEHPHVNTQLFGTVAPASNRFADVDDMAPPFNAPADPAAVPTMQGFVADYVHTFRAGMGRLPRYDEYAQILACYSPERVPVLSGLANGFACFDHWFCEVPSQTYPNRSFFHAASSSGFVLNGPFGKFAGQNDAPTVFERLETAGRSWRVYIDPEQILPATGLIHARRLAPFFATHFCSLDDFFEDARSGTLPEYAFLEPNMFHPHTDFHPPGVARLRHGLRLPAPDSIRGGERLLAEVYEAVRSSAHPGGSNWWNTMLLVTFDEHGGTFDHVPPPPAAPPDPAAPPGEEGFRFDRSGVRIPTVLVSAWVEPGTVVREVFRSTSVIRTLRERWSLGPPLTGRDASAPALAPVLTRTSPRPPEEWPRVEPAPLGVGARVAFALDRLLSLPMERLERELIGEALAHVARTGKRATGADPRSMSHADAHGHAERIGAELFPKVARRRRT